LSGWAATGLQGAPLKQSEGVVKDFLAIADQDEIIAHAGYFCESCLKQQSDYVGFAASLIKKTQQISILTLLGSGLSTSLKVNDDLCMTEVRI
jgi:hypothetical protein